METASANASQEFQHDYSHENHYDEGFVPPENFALVSRGVFRSAMPMKRNFRFLERIGLKSVLFVFTQKRYRLIARTLILEEYPEQNRAWLESKGIQLFQFGVPGNKVRHYLYDSRLEMLYSIRFALKRSGTVC